MELHTRAVAVATVLVALCAVAPVCHGYSQMGQMFLDMVQIQAFPNPDVWTNYVDTNAVRYLAEAWHAHVGFGDWKTDLNLPSDSSKFIDHCYHSDMANNFHHMIVEGYYGNWSKDGNFWDWPYQGVNIPACAVNNDMALQGQAAFVYFQKEAGNHSESAPVEAAVFTWRFLIGLKQKCFPHDDTISPDPVFLSAEREMNYNVTGSQADYSLNLKMKPVRLGGKSQSTANESGIGAQYDPGYDPGDVVMNWTWNLVLKVLKDLSHVWDSPNRSYGYATETHPATISYY